MRALAVVVALACSGCALLASANAHHNSRGTACVETPAFALIDIAIAGAAAGIGAAEDSTGAYVTAGVFGASGALGGISAAMCSEAKAPREDDAPPASNTAPSFGDAPVDPEAREATPEEMGIAPITPVAPMPSTPVKLQLDGAYDVDKHKPPPPASPDKRACRDEPSSCGPAETCAIAGDDAGYCVVDDSR